MHAGGRNGQHPARVEEQLPDGASACRVRAKGGIAPELYTVKSCDAALAGTLVQFRHGTLVLVIYIRTRCRSTADPAGYQRQGCWQAWAAREHWAVVW